MDRNTECRLCERFFSERILNTTFVSNIEQEEQDKSKKEYEISLKEFGGAILHEENIYELKVDSVGNFRNGIMKIYYCPICVRKLNMSKEDLKNGTALQNNDRKD